MYDTVEGYLVPGEICTLNGLLRRSVVAERSEAFSHVEISEHSVNNGRGVYETPHPISKLTHPVVPDESDVSVRILINFYNAL